MPQFLIDFGNWLYEILYAMVATIGVMLYDLLLFIMSGFFALGRLALDGVALTLNTLNLGSYMTFLSPEVKSWIIAIGIPEAIGMIITAITVRIILQLIPFTRLGS